MKISEAFPSKYVQASDLAGREVKVVIKGVQNEEMRDGSLKPVLYFHGTDKGLVLNKTNGGTIADMFGDDTDGWTNRSITLYPTRVDFQGNRVDAIRVKFIQPPPRPAQAPPPRNTSFAAPATQYDDRDPPPATEYPAHADMNDEIPF
jgi:hypothetical protein